MFPWEEFGGAAKPTPTPKAGPWEDFKTNISPQPEIGPWADYQEPGAAPNPASFEVESGNTTVRSEIQQPKPAQIVPAPETPIGVQKAGRGISNLFDLLAKPQEFLYKNVLTPLKEKLVPKILPWTEYQIGGERIERLANERESIQPGEFFFGPEKTEMKTVQSIYGPQKVEQKVDEPWYKKIGRLSERFVMDPLIAGPGVARKAAAAAGGTALGAGLAAEGSKFVKDIKNTAAVKTLVRKPYQYVFGGEFGTLSVDHPELAKELTNVSRKLRANESVTSEEISKLSDELRFLPDEDKQGILTALQKPSALTGEIREFSTLNPVPGAQSLGKEDLKGFYKSQSESSFTQLQQEIDRIAKRYKIDPEYLKNLVYNTEDLNKIVNEMNMHPDYLKSAAQGLLKPWTNPQTGEVSYFPLREGRKTPPQYLKRMASIQERYRELRGKMRETDIMSEEQVREATKGMFKIGPEVNLSPQGKLIYEKLNSLRNEMVENYKSIGFSSSRIAPGQGPENFIPQIERGTEAGRFFKQPALTPMPPKGGLTLNPETKEMMSIQRVNELRAQRGQPPLVTDLDVLYGVGLKESRDAKIVGKWLEGLPDKFGKPFEGKKLVNDLGGYTDRSGLQPGFDTFSEKELRNLPASFKGKQFPEELVKKIRKGLEVGEKGPESTFGQYYQDYLNVYKAYALSSPRYVLKNQLGNIWNNYLSDVGIDMKGEGWKALRGEAGVLKSKSGREYTYEEIRKFAMENDITTGMFRGEVKGIHSPKAIPEETLNKLPPILREKLGARGPIPQFFFKGAGNIEAHDRLWHFMEKLREGKTPEEAANSVFNALFDYKDLSPALRQAKKAFLFPTFPMKNVPYQVKMMVERPDKFALLSHVYNFLQTPPKDNVPLEDWVRDSWPLKVGDYYYLFDQYVPAGQLNDVLKPFTRMARGGANAARDIGDQVFSTLAGATSPMFTAAISAWANKSFLTKGNVENYSRAKTEVFGVPVERRFEPLIVALPLVGKAYQETSRFGRAEKPILQEPERSLPRKIADYTIGKGIYDNPEKRLYNRAAQIQAARQDLFKAFNDLAVRGLLSPEEKRERIVEFLQKIRSMREE